MFEKSDTKLSKLSSPRELNPVVETFELDSPTDKKEQRTKERDQDDQVKIESSPDFAIMKNIKTSCMTVNEPNADISALQVKPVIKLVETEISK